MSSTGEREAMALLAARLMAGEKSSPAAASSSASLPRPTSTIQRSMPSLQDAPGQSAPRTQSVSLGKNGSSPHARHAAPVMEGPSLRGSAEQLMEARVLQASMTQGDGKSRGGSSSRSRVLSQAPSSSSTDYAPPTAPLRPRPSTSAANAAPASSIPSGLGQWKALRGQSAAQAAPILHRSDSVIGSGTPTPSVNKDLTGQMPLPIFDGSPNKVESSDQPGSILGSTMAKSIAATVQPWQVKEIANTLHNRASEAPPRLRQTAWRKPVASVQSPSHEPESDTAASTSLIADKKTAQGTEKTPANVEANTAAFQPVQSPPAPVTTNEYGGSAAVDHVKREIDLLAGRIAFLEEENFGLRRQMEALEQADERRRFLGTNTAKTPFGLDVQDPSGKVIKVQASAGLKVGDLIRRIRAKANVPPMASKDPRVVFGDSELGHGLTLGEVGLVEGSCVLFTFSV